MKIPTIHNNGTSREVLLNDADEAIDAITIFVKQFRSMTPHARDYYPQGVRALLDAMSEHRVLMDRAISIQKELRDYVEAISEQESSK